jgi:hypothetical protein
MFFPAAMLMQNVFEVAVIVAAMVHKKNDCNGAICYCSLLFEVAVIWLAVKAAAFMACMVTDVFTSKGCHGYKGRCCEVQFKVCSLCD